MRCKSDYMRDLVGIPISLQSTLDHTCEIIDIGKSYCRPSELQEQNMHTLIINFASDIYAQSLALRRVDTFVGSLAFKIVGMQSDLLHLLEGHGLTNNVCGGYRKCPHFMLWVVDKHYL